MTRVSNALVYAQRSYRLRRFWLDAPLAVIGLVLHIDAAHAQPAPQGSAVSGNTQLTDVVVKGRNSAKAAEARLNKIAGGVSVVDSAEVGKGRVSSNADLFKLQPGVIASLSGAGGTNAAKVSIRGSGVNNNFGAYRTGIKYEFDGLPYTGPSGTPYELFETQGLNYTEILRGNNAFTTGDLALGGTINYVTKTGRTAPYSEAYTELGSYGHVKGSIATGGVVGPWDYYVNVIGERQSGWQQNSEAWAEHIIANIGYQFNENVSTRVYFRYAKMAYYSPGAITKAQLESDQPDQANPNYLATKFQWKKPGSLLIGDVTKIQIDDTQNLELGLDFQNMPIVATAQTPSAPYGIKYNYSNLAAQVKYTNNTKIFGHGNEFTAATYWSDDIVGDDKLTVTASDGSSPYGTKVTFFGVPGVTAGQTFIWRKFGGSTDAIQLLSDDFEVIKDVWFTAGGAITETPRYLSVYGLTSPYAGSKTQISENVSSSTHEANIIHRVGLRWDVSPDLQLFANYGGNIEPHQDWAGEIGPDVGALNYQIPNLKNQQTDTAEVGFRGQYGVFRGSADYYHAQVSDELLTVLDPSLNVSTTLNAPHSTHQGVEASLDTVLWKSGPGDYWSNDPGVTRLHLVQVFDWTDVHFNEGGRIGSYYVGGKQEAGIPPEYYQGELALDTAAGFYANVDARVSSGTYADYLNTFRAAPYVVYGLTAGWQQKRSDKRGWQVSVSVDNLTNTKYAVAISPVFNASGKDQANEYAGAGIGAYSSIDYKF